MGMFGKKDNEKLSGTFMGESIPRAVNPVNYDTVLDYLTSLNAEDFEKIFKVSTIYRKANTEAADVLGLVETATASISTELSEDEQDDEDLENLLDDDELNNAFLDAESEPPVKKVTAKKIQ